MRYQAYGLSFDCDRPIPELAGSADRNSVGSPDLRTRLTSRFATVLRPVKIVSVRTFGDGRPWLKCGRLRDGYLLRFLRIADFRVSHDSREIVCVRRSAKTSLNTIRHLLLDQVFPLVLNLRGREAIHATAVIARAGAIAFLGPAGAGKSTLAASFMLAGFRALGDDCLAIEAGRRILAVPAYPGFRLWEDSAAALKADLGASTPVADYSVKARMLAGECGANFPQRPVALRRIYRLIRGRAGRKKIRVAAVEPVAPRDALIELVSASFPLDIADQAMLERHFRVMQRVAREVPMRRVLIPDDFGALPAVRAAILADLAAG